MRVNRPMLRRVGVLLLLLAPVVALSMQLIFHNLATPGESTVISEQKYGGHLYFTTTTQDIHFHWPGLIPLSVVVAGLLLICISCFVQPTPPPLPGPRR